MTRFVHLTDLHVTAPQTPDHTLKTDTPGTLARVVAAIGAMDPAPAFVVASGDLTNLGDAVSYRLLRDLLAPLQMPVVLALGNHDNRAAFHDVFETGLAEAPFFGDRVLAGIHVLTLDTLVPGRVAGMLDDAQLAWLDAALARHPGVPKLVVAHHPPHLGDDALPWATLDAASSARFAATLAGRGVIGILSGHVHVNRVTVWQGIPVFIAMGLNSTVDLLEPADMRIVEGTAFGLFTLRPSGLTVSFVPVTPDRRELARIDVARLRAFS